MTREDLAMIEALERLDPDGSQRRRAHEIVRTHLAMGLATRSELVGIVLAPIFARKFTSVRMMLAAHRVVGSMIRRWASEPLSFEN